MMLRSILISNGAFVIKAFFAFALTTYLANSMKAEDFATWSILISVSMFFTLSDFGAGQYLLRRFVTGIGVEGFELERKTLVLNSKVVFLIVSVFFMFVSIFVAGFYPGLNELKQSALLLFFVLVLARTFFTPYLALLSAYEFFHLRKVIEATTYVAAFLVVYLASSFDFSVAAIINAYAIVFFVGAVAPFFLCRHLKLISGFAGFDSVSKSVVTEILVSSVPYFINNLSLLVTRGGLVFFAGLLLIDTEVVVLAIYYALFYQVVFQFFDIVVRSLQPRALSNPRGYKKAEFLLYIFLVCFVFCGAFGGEVILGLLYPKISFEYSSMLIFIVLGAVEILFSMMNAKWQMDSRFNGLVALSSMVKAIMYLVFFVLFSFGYTSDTLHGFLLGVLWINIFVVSVSALFQYVKGIHRYEA